MAGEVQISLLNHLFTYIIMSVFYRETGAFIL